MTGHVGVEETRGKGRREGWRDMDGWGGYGGGYGDEESSYGG